MSDTPVLQVPVLEVSGLVKHFPITRGVVRRKLVGLVRAVEDVSFEIARGETLALVGESGCGKSTTGRLVLRLMDPTAGSVRFKGEEIAGLDKQTLRRMRRHMQIIFQDPYASLNPRMTVGQMLEEPLALHGLADMLRTADMVERSRRRALPRRILPTLYDRRTRSGVQSLEQLREMHGAQVWPGVVPMDTRLRDANALATPAEQASRGIEAYARALAWLLGDDDQQREAA